MTTETGVEPGAAFSLDGRAAPAPRENLYRAMAGGATSADGRTLTVRLAPADQWAEIHSEIEGHFMERFSRSAYRKTMAERLPKIMFQHGRDPEIGDKPIATTEAAGEDEISPYARGTLLDGVPPLVVAGLRADPPVYGASHRFSVIREEWNPTPGGGLHNPDKLPERTITEAALHELGPVTWPAYLGASVALRSITDEMNTAPGAVSEAPSLDAAAETPHLEPERRDEPVVVAAVQHEEQAVPPDISTYRTRDEKAARVGDIEREMTDLDSRFDGVMPDEQEAQWDSFKEEKRLLLAAIDAVDARRADLAKNAVRDNVIVPGQWTPPSVNVVKTRDLSSIYDVRRIERESSNELDRVQRLRDAAMRAVEGAPFPTTERAKGQAEVESLLKGVDYVDPAEAAKRVLYTGNPAYRRAYRRWLTQSAAGPMFTAEEANAFEEARTALVTASNAAVPFDLDSTMVINTSGAINPFRQAFRVVKTTSNDWRPLVSSGMTAVYEDEAIAATDLSPAFTAPARLLVKAHTAATFSVEIQGDYPGLEAEIAKEIADAKDVLEATQFATGLGTTHFPQGIYTYFSANFLDTTTTLVVVPADLYKLEANIGPRYRANTVWLGSPYFYSLVRGIDTAGGAGLWIDNLALPNFGSIENNGRLGALIGHPAYEAIAPANSTMATTEKVAILANRDRFVIIDRIGINMELIPNFLDVTTGYPTGQRMVYAWWRNTSVGIGLATLGAGRAACIFRGK